MSLSSLKNERGLTLTELIVALAISSILLIFVVSGNLFVQNYIRSWKQSDKIYEELAFVSSVISEAVFESRGINLYQDSLVCWSKTRDKTVYAWGDGSLDKNGAVLSRAGLRLDTLAIATLELQKEGDSVIFIKGQDVRRCGLFEVYIVISDARNLTDSLRSVVRNEYAIVKYHQK